MEILTECQGRVLRIGINRPAKKNALTAAMYTALVEAFERADRDAEIRAIVIHGDEQVFSAGNDLDDFVRNPPTGMNSPVLQFLACISTARKPVVAAVNGIAVGVGVTLLLHCDLVYAGDQARFSLPFVNLGLCPEAASSLLLPRLAGHQWAAEKLLLGESFDACDAYEMRLVNRVVAPEEVLPLAQAQAERLAALPPESVRLTKALLKGMADRPAIADPNTDLNTDPNADLNANATAHAVAARMAEEAGHFARLLQGPAAAEAFAAFAERRPPDFSRLD